MIKRLLIIGLGSIGRRHLKIARNLLPAVEIMVLRHRPVSADPEMLYKVTYSLEEALRFHPEAAIIATPAPFHLEAAKALAAIGCHLLIEKPIAASSGGFEDFLALVKCKKIVCQVGYNLRFSPSLSLFRLLVKDGRLGQIRSARAEVGQYLPDWRANTDYRQGVSACSHLGGGVLLELSHELDYLAWIFGGINWVQAWVGTISDLVIDVEDSAHLILGIQSETSGRETVVSLDMDFYRRDTTRCCIAIGSEGSLLWNGVEGTVDWYRADEASWVRLFCQPQQRDDTYRNQFAHFLDCIIQGAQPSVSSQEGFAALAVAEAARASSLAEGRRMKPRFSALV